MNATLVADRGRLVVRGTVRATVDQILACTVRDTRGQQIVDACGQLAAEDSLAVVDGGHCGSPRSC